MNQIIYFYQNKNLFKFLIFIWIMSIPFKNSIYQISVVLILIYFFYHLLKTKHIDVLLENLNKTIYLTVGFVLLIISMHVSNLLNLDNLNPKSWSIIYFFVIRYGFVFIALAYFYKLNFFQSQELVQWLFCSFFFLGLLGIYQIIIDPSILLGQGIQATLSNRNAFGLFMGMGFILNVLLIKHSKLLKLFFLFFFGFLMIFSFSRSSWIASFISSIILFIINYKKIDLKNILLFLSFIAFILLIYCYFESFQTRLHQLFIGHSSNRTFIWTHTIDFIKQQLYFGYGIDSFKNLPNPSISKYHDPHNMILEIFISTGILGILASFLIIFIILSKIHKEKKYLLFPIAAYFLIVTQFDFGAFTSKELLSFLTIFVFYIYAHDFRDQE